MDGGPKITRLAGWNTFLCFSGNTLLQIFSKVLDGRRFFISQISGL